MSLILEQEETYELEFDVAAVAESVIEQSLEKENCPYDCSVSLLLTTNESIQELNKEFRDIDSATDVLSFPMIEFAHPSDFSKVEEAQADCFDPDTGELLLGDIVISTDKVRDQAKAYGHSEVREFAFLIAHSMLHLFGYDHMEEAEAKVMEEKQEEILKELQISR